MPGFGSARVPTCRRVVGWSSRPFSPIVSIGLGQAGLWEYGRREGGVLAPLDYLAEVYGPLVPLQLLAAAGAAWLGAR